jgi:hypothetical protein
VCKYRGRWGGPHTHVPRLVIIESLSLYIYLYVSVHAHAHTTHTHAHNNMHIHARLRACIYVLSSSSSVCVLECVRVCTDRPVVGVVQSAHCVIFENRVVFCVYALSHGCVRTIPIQDGKVTLLLLLLRLFICIYRDAISAAAAVFLDRPSPTAASRQDIVTFV